MNIICYNKKTIPNLVFEIGNYYFTLSNDFFTYVDNITLEDLKTI